MKIYDVRFTCHVYRDHCETVVFNKQFFSLEEAKDFERIIKKHLTHESRGRTWLKNKFLEEGTIYKFNGTYEVTTCLI